MFKLPWQSKEPQIAGYAYIVEEAIGRLPNAHQRLRILELAHVNACMPVLDQTHRRGHPPRFDPLPEEVEAAKAFWEEVETIAAVMKEKGVLPFPLKGTYGSSDNDLYLAERERERIRRWVAIQTWSWFAIPWRVVGDRVCVIGAPQHHELDGPNIRSFPIADFLVMVADAMFPSKRNKDRDNL